MKKVISFALFMILATAVYCLAQTEGNPMMPPAGVPQFNPYMPMSSPWANRGPGMGNYGFKGFAPGMGYGWGGGFPPPPSGGVDPSYYKYGPGLMMGQGMMQFGMGPGMIRGIGVMGYISSEAFQKFFDETRDMRKELNGLMFDYAELLRKPNHDAAARVKLENKIMALRQKVYDKAPRYQWPFQ